MLLNKWSVVLFALCPLIWLVSDAIMTNDKSYVQLLKEKYHQAFFHSCLKYRFVERYLEILRDQPREYFIFVFEEGSRMEMGGLGDRLAGMVTGFAFAMRSNRTFLIQGNAMFERAFHPFHVTANDTKTWADWSWAHWDRGFAANMTKLHCVNPRPSQSHCALDSVEKLRQFQVIKFYGNRNYLCRWLFKDDTQLEKEIYASLGLSRSSNLYEAAGCMLRLALAPTPVLWEAVAAIAHPPLPTASMDIKLVCAHFRCGDSSFAQDVDVTVPNPQCYVSADHNWTGTQFLDDWSSDSPVDLATCAAQLVTNATTTAVLYIASDNVHSAQQMIKTASWNNTIHPTRSCHMDMHKRDASCTYSTLAQWLLMALSDNIITQSHHSRISDRHRGKDEQEEAAPISAFSRYAMIYSLAASGLYYGVDCQAANTTKLSQQTHGNWVCTPHRFY